ncbi:MAG TPA: radical SAM protein [Sedimentisphaerales bacterium]|nr:radical SAM protein [Sedimentisphaerales bacterium]HRS09503.1 radical SAM protein [Sedimentisphaerales bacterium]HRV46200.1 radical SAM protein [Sedimentisphaerales bacterium]
MDLARFSSNVRRLGEKTDPCTLCPRRCGARRNAGQVGFCGIGSDAVVSSMGPHFGEESVLVGAGGSGTIFFAGCNLGCIFCQNYDISHLRQGRRIDVEQLADAMLGLQQIGCVNVNLVTPTHIAAPVAAAIETARNKGLRIPTVYNTGGYDAVETLHLLEGLIDIYMPDVKYADASVAAELSAAADYPQVCFAAVQEMHRQVGDLQIERGIATRGLLVRHLVLPENLAGSVEVIDFLADRISPHTTINVMGQYRPCYQAPAHPKIARRPTPDEIAAARGYARARGLTVLD